MQFIMLMTYNATNEKKLRTLLSNILNNNGSHHWTTTYNLSSFVNRSTLFLCYQTIGSLCYFSINIQIVDTETYTILHFRFLYSSTPINTSIHHLSYSVCPHPDSPSDILSPMFSAKHTDLYTYRLYYAFRYIFLNNIQ